MRKATTIPILLLTLMFASSAFSWTGQWSNLYPFTGPWGNPIPPGSLIQLIHAGPNGVVDDPRGSLNISQWMVWIAAGCPPVGDDTLVDQTVFLDYGVGYEGYFGKSISGTDSQQGDPWYTRFFTAAQPDLCDYYGTVGDPEDPDDPIYELVLTGWNGSSYDFGDYKIKLENVCADTHMLLWPEPPTMLIGGIALILVFFRMRK
jgi:hypothetical protein